MALPTQTMSYLQPITPTWDRLDMISHGAYPSVYPFQRIGYNPDIDNAEETIWPAGGAYVFPTAAMQMELVSTSENDKAAGTGALTVRLNYLDQYYINRYETVTMNGTTPVPTAATNILRVNNISVLTAGTTKANEGIITCRHLDDTPVYSYMAVADNSSFSLAYTVPYGLALFITTFTASSHSATDGQYTRVSFKNNYDRSTESKKDFFLPILDAYVMDEATGGPIDVPIRMSPTTDVIVTGKSTGASSSAIVAASYRGYLEIV